MRSYLCVLMVNILGFTQSGTAQNEQYSRILGRIDPPKVKLDAGIDVLDVARDGKSIVCSGTSAIRQISFPDGKTIQNYSFKTPYPLMTAVYSLDAKRVIGVQPGIRVWDTESAKSILAVDWPWMDKPFDPKKRDPRWPTTLPVFSPDRSRVYVSGPEDVISVWDITTGKEITRSAPLGQRTYSMSLSSDGKHLALGFRDGFRIWEAAALKETSAQQLPAESYQSEGMSYRVCFHPVEKQLYVIGHSAIKDGRAREELQAWDYNKMKMLFQVPVADRDFDCVLVLPGSRYGLIANSRISKGGNVVDLTDGRMLGSILFSGSSHPLTPTPDGKQLIAGTGSRFLSSISVDDLTRLLPREEKP